jgi:hypothetical protein
MKKKILTHLIGWLCAIGIEILFYFKYWSGTTGKSFFVKYFVLAATCYACYFFTIYCLKKGKGIFELKNTHKLLLIMTASTFSTLLHLGLDYFILKTNYGLQIGIYFLSRLWVITPIVFGLITLLEKETGKKIFVYMQQQYAELNRNIEALTAEKEQIAQMSIKLTGQNELLSAQNAQFIAEQERLKQAKGSLETDIIMLKGLFGAMQEEYRKSQNEMQDLLRKLNDKNDSKDE